MEAYGSRLFQQAGFGEENARVKSALAFLCAFCLAGRYPDMTG